MAVLSYDRHCEIVRRLEDDGVVAIPTPAPGFSGPQLTVFDLQEIAKLRRCGVADLVVMGDTGFVKLAVAGS